MNVYEKIYESITETRTIKEAETPEEVVKRNIAKRGGIEAVRKERRERFSKIIASKKRPNPENQKKAAIETHGPGGRTFQAKMKAKEDEKETQKRSVEMQRRRPDAGDEGPPRKSLADMIRDKRKETK